MALATLVGLLLSAVLVPHQHHVHAFTTNHNAQQARRSHALTPLFLETTSDRPQVFSSGYSTKGDLVEALQEAVSMAVEGLPTGDGNLDIDLGLVFVSSLYDVGAHPPATTVIPTILEAVRASSPGGALQELIGCSAAGTLGSAYEMDGPIISNMVATMEAEGVHAVSLTLAVLPDTRVSTFCVSPSDVPDDVGRLDVATWQRAVGLPSWLLASAPVVHDDDTDDNSEDKSSNDDSDAPIVLLLPSPAFATELDDFLRGLETYLPTDTTILGSLSSTVSSLSRARVYQYSASSGSAAGGCYGDACVGVALQGDVQVQSFTAQGAKPVGGIYQIVKGEATTVQVIVLDETATEALGEDEDVPEEEEEDAEAEPLDARAQMQQAYAKAHIPKPTLAEANFLMKSLSDDDQAFMRRQLLIGLDQGGPLTASELVRLAEGKGHRFRVLAVATAGMKDGSVTLPLGSVVITPGTRMRFFVREPGFAKQELEALWLGYKKRQFKLQLDQTETSWTPTACFIFPTLDRGQKFFMGKSGFESSAAARMLPGTPCIQGFFGNGVIGRWDGNTGPVGVQGSASGYFLFGSKSGRRLFNPADVALQRIEADEERKAKVLQAEIQAAEDEKRQQRAKGIAAAVVKAPRNPNGELLLKRREVHSGRALTVSTVEWSVVENMATPTSTLEGYMWDKETEVDRFRERVPLANLVSQCRLSSTDPRAPKPRDFVGPIRQAAAAGDFVIVPELKRLEPAIGSLRRNYDLPKLAREFTLAGAPALSVNCDGVLFGGSLEDITKARQASSSAAVEQSSAEDGVIVPPILSSDLLLYPYQLYKLRLAGTDAVNMLVGALADKDLVYLSKIAASLQIQMLATVTSEVQLRAIANLPAGSVQAIIVSNRDLEDFGFDMTGQQALNLLKSEALQETLGKHDVPVLVEGRVGLIEGSDGSTASYLKDLKDAGATGAIVGGGLIAEGKSSTEVMKSLQQV
jgi:indole-3-glycerol phosphate synthase